MKLRIRKIRIVVMMSEENIRNIAKYNKVAPLSKGVQDFYNGPCAAVDITNLSHENELITLLSSLISYHRNNKVVLEEE